MLKNKFNSKLYKKVNIILITILGILIVEALIWGFGWRLSKIYTDIKIFKYGNPSEGWNPIIWQENGIIEIIQEALLFITIIYLINIYFFIKKNSSNKLHYYKIFIILKILALSYFLLEEISWGQQLINFKTPNFFLNKNSIFYNHQEEFNLHNTSNLFNEIPRALVLIWCAFSILIVMKFKKSITIDFQKIICPSDKLLFISIIIIIFTIPDLILTKIGFIDYSNIHIINNQGFEIYNIKKIIPIILSFNFFRLSELQEFLFIYYFFWHSFFLKKTINSKIFKNKIF